MKDINIFVLNGYIGRNGIFIGMKSFGASAPANELYEHFGITADNLVNKIKAKL